MIGPDDWLAAIRTEGAAFAAIPADRLDAPVPSCPDWTVHDLVSHLGAVHRWANTRITRADGPRGIRSDAAPPGAEVRDWYAESLAMLLDTFAATTPDAPAPTFVGERTVAFWLRRQAHEIAVHRWDADQAVRAGAERPIDAPLAVDGIDEWLELFVPRFVGPDVIPPALVGRTVHLHATDIEDGEWLLTVTPDGIAHTRGHRKGDAAVRGTASDLLLAAWHRRQLDELDVVGDTALPAEVYRLVHVT